jgi:hypothetical protein
MTTAVHFTMLSALWFTSDEHGLKLSVSETAAAAATDDSAFELATSDPVEAVKSDDALNPTSSFVLSTTGNPPTDDESSFQDADDASFGNAQSSTSVSTSDKKDGAGVSGETMIAFNDECGANRSAPSRRIRRDTNDNDVGICRSLEETEVVDVRRSLMANDGESSTCRRRRTTADERCSSTADDDVADDGDDDDGDDSDSDDDDDEDDDDYLDDDDDGDFPMDDDDDNKSWRRIGNEVEIAACGLP